MPLTLTNIPRIMRHPNQNWVKAALLMEKWFSRSRAAAPNYSEPDSTTITMDWVLSFPRARRIYDRMVTERIWTNQAAQATITQMLRRKGFLGEAQNSFNYLTLPAYVNDPDYINYREVPYDANDLLEHLSAALGRFTFRIVIAGSVSPSAPPLVPGHVVIINEVGVYVKDSYDFEGQQSLGYWNEAGNSVRIAEALGWELVSNEDFRNYRARTGQGGDFLIFSDIRRILLPNPNSFLIPVNA